VNRKCSPSPKNTTSQLSVSTRYTDPKPSNSPYPEDGIHASKEKLKSIKSRLKFETENKYISTIGDDA